MSCRVFPDNEWCTEASPCFGCVELIHDEQHPAFDDPQCETCRLRSIQLSPAATPTKTRRVGTLGPKGNNSWERGIVRDERGVPVVKATGEFVPVKEWGENRSRYESARRRVMAGHVPKE